MSKKRKFFFSVGAFVLLATAVPRHSQARPLAQTEETQNIQFVGQIGGSSPWSPRAVATAGNYLYVADSGFGLRIINVSDPANPALQGSLSIPGGAVDVARAGSYVYLSANGLRIIDVANPQSPTPVGFYETGVSGIIELGSSYAYLSSGSLRIIDVTNSQRPTQVGVYDRQASDFVVAGRYAYMTGSGGGLYILDVTDPQGPTLVGQYTWPNVSGLDVAGNYVYVVGSTSNLDDAFGIIEVTDPRNPRKVTSVRLPYYGSSVSVKANCAYVLYYGGVRIFDISNPRSPVQVGSYNLSSSGFLGGLAVAGNQIYVGTNRLVLLLRYTGSACRMGTPAELGAPADGTRLNMLGTPLTWTLPPGTAQYQVQVNPANNDGPGINHIRNAETSYTIPPPVMGQGNYVILPGMTYSWRVRATAQATFAPEDDPFWGPWSPTWTFRTPPPNSATISLISPANGSTVASAAPLAIRWDNASGNIFYYEVQASPDPNFGEQGAVAAVWHNLVHGGVTNPLNSWLTPELQPATTYYWRVRPRVQGDGAPVAWSAAWSFRTP